MNPEAEQALDELKPCPFCNIPPASITSKIDGKEYYSCLNVDCPNGSWLTAAEWNTRPIEDALNARIAELSQAVGLITTMKPTMVMDANHPLDMVREVGEHVTARIAELEAAQRWIPVSERLPEPYTRVLACIKSGYMEVDYMYSEPIVDVGSADFNSLDNVTHWMPLPQPPEVQE